MDISIKNQRIRNFLDGKTSTVPFDELHFLFSHQDTPSFLEDIKKNLLAKAKYARQGGKPMDTFLISEAMVVIVKTSATFVLDTSTEEEKREAINEVASALKFLWTTSTTPLAKSKNL